jgi:hypothetical protein
MGKQLPRGGRTPRRGELSHGIAIAKSQHGKELVSWLSPIEGRNPLT